MPKKAKILIVDDEPRIRDSLNSLLQDQGYETQSAESGEKALSLMEKSSWDLALLDIVLPDQLGLALIKNFHKKNPGSAVIMLTGNASIDSAVDALRKGAYDYLRKPFEISELKTTIKNALTQQALRKQNKTFQKKLRQSQKQYRYLINTSPDIIYTLNPHGQFTFVNNAVKDLIGLNPRDVIGSHYSKVIGQNNADKCRWLINERRTGQRAKKRNQLRLLKYDPFGHPRKDFLFAELQSIGMYRKSIDRNPPIYLGTYGVIRDVTEQRSAEIEKQKMQQQLEQAQKMEAVGTIASGVAHDLNNILSSVLAYPDLILMQMRKNDPLREYILQIKNSGEKATVIVDDLLTLARRRVSVSAAICLDEIIQSYFKSAEHLELRNQFPGTTFDLNLSCGSTIIWGSRVHLHKCFMNLCNNAVEAMPEGGQVRIRTRLTTFPDQNRSGLSLPEGQYVKLTISDTGMGIEQDEIKKIFDPFYSKKTLGKSGTGLGMTIVWTTVQDHNAHIDVKSQMGQGTTFSLFFPITQKQSKIKQTSNMKLAKGKGESVLIVDDIPEQREIATKMMSALGYKTSCAASGEEGVEYLKSNQTDLILLDMMLGPGMDGLDTYKEIKKIDPELKVIIVSGAAHSDRINKALRIGARQFIKKPYSLEIMATSLRNELLN